MIWIFSFPIAFLAMFSAVGGYVNHLHDPSLSVRVATALLPGLLAQGILLSSFTNLASTTAQDRERGNLKRLRATPLPAAHLFAGKIAMVLIVTFVQCALLIAVGVAFFGVQLPTTASAWGTIALLLMLGVAAGSVCGIAFSSFTRTAKSASNIASGIVMLLSFISGVFIVGATFPVWMTRVAQAFPLYWLVGGLRRAMYPSWLYHGMTTGEPRPMLGLVVIAAWLVVGLGVALKWFRWQQRRG
jgi:ABC-2 type transport system permease protein